MIPTAFGRKSIHLYLQRNTRAFGRICEETGVTGFELHATKEGEMVYKQNGFVIHDEPTYRMII